MNPWIIKAILAILASYAVFLWDKIPQWKKEEEAASLQELEDWYESYKGTCFRSGTVLKVRSDWIENRWVYTVYRDGKVIVITPFGEL